MVQGIKIRDLTIGEGIPKICAPIVGKSREEILRGAVQLKQEPVDLAEWRVDFFEGAMEPALVKELLHALREVLFDMPLLFTCRTADEGGELALSLEEYIQLNIEAVKAGQADMIDVEIFRGDEAARHIIEAAHKAGIRVVGSNHDFHKTPDEEELLARLLKMHALQADILKIAVMPGSKRDVLTLLSATAKMQDTYADRPVVTMAMGQLGLVSRLSGEVFGSAITFGSVGAASAPGQIPAGQLKQILGVIHG